MHTSNFIGKCSIFEQVKTVVEHFCCDISCCSEDGVITVAPLDHANVPSQCIRVLRTRSSENFNLSFCRQVPLYSKLVQVLRVIFSVSLCRISHAAKAYEGCDRSFKPVFADPRPQKPLVDDRYSSAHGSTTGPSEKIHRKHVD